MLTLCLLRRRKTKSNPCGLDTQLEIYVSSHAARNAKSGSNSSSYRHDELNYQLLSVLFLSVLIMLFVGKLATSASFFLVFVRRLTIVFLRHDSAKSQVSVHGDL